MELPWGVIGRTLGTMERFVGQPDTIAQISHCFWPVIFAVHFSCILSWWLGQPLVYQKCAAGWVDKWQWHLHSAAWRAMLRLSACGHGVGDTKKSHTGFAYGCIAPVLSTVARVMIFHFLKTDSSLGIRSGRNAGKVSLQAQLDSKSLRKAAHLDESDDHDPLEFGVLRCAWPKAPL